MFTEVSQEEFWAFIDSYDGDLVRRVDALTEPMHVMYCDPRRGRFPLTVVATYGDQRGVQSDWQIKAP